MLPETQLLRVQLGERLAAVAKEMFRVVDETLSEYEGEILHCRSEISRLELHVKQLTAAEAKIVTDTTDTAVRQSITQEASTQPEQIVVVEKTETCEPPLLNVEQVEVCILPEEGADSAPESVGYRISTRAGNPTFPSSNESTSKLDEYREQVRRSVRQKASTQPEQSVAVKETGTEPPLGKVAQEELRILPKEGADSAPKSVEEGISTRAGKPTSPSSNELTVKLKESRCGGGSGSSSSLPKRSAVGSSKPDRGEREKSRVCHLCGETFKTDRLLIRHVDAMHKGEKAFKCSECSRQFAQRELLIVHDRKHNGERPFICPFCQKSFAQNSSLKQHLKRHTGEKPYHCDKCGKMVAHKYHLKVCGTKRAKKEKSYSCLLCGQTLESSKRLKLHMRIHEAMTAQPTPDFVLDDFDYP